MTTMKTNFTMLMLMVAAISFCSQQQVVVGREVVVADDKNGLQPSCSAGDKEKVEKCLNAPLIDPCCPTFESILGTSCSCNKYFEEYDNEALITLEAYCGFTSPCKGVQVIKLSKEE